MPKEKPVAPYYHTSPFTSLLFLNEAGTTAYCFGPSYERDDPREPVRLCGADNDSGWDDWYIFYNEDCYQPAMYAICEQGFAEAHEKFLEDQYEALKITKEEYADYGFDPDNNTSGEMPPHVMWTSKGWVDTELVRGFPVNIIEARV